MIPERLYDRTIDAIAGRRHIGPMCGRFTQSYTWQQVQEFLSVFGERLNLQPRYNIAPTTPIDVVRLGLSGRELVRMRWGLIPAWWREPTKKLPATFNARVEGIAWKPMFRKAFKSRRCIIPASGFYEWTGEKSGRIPHLFTAADGSPILAFAGLWEAWRDALSGEEVLSATVIVSGASDWMKPYHDRMPVLLTPDQFEPWLSGEAGLDSLVPASRQVLREWIVSDRVNRSGQDDEDATLMAAVATG